MELLKHGEFKKENNYTFFGEGHHLGFELEIDKEGEFDENFKNNLINLFANKESEHYFIEKDSSLVSGIEIITQPHSKELVDNFLDGEFKELLSEIKECTSIERCADTAGLHIHISENIFGDDELTRNESISKLMLCVSKNYEKISDLLDIMRLNYVNKYSTKIPIEDKLSAQVHIKRSRNVLKYMKKEIYKYNWVTLRRDGTVEFRIFNSTLDSEKIKRAIEICWNLCEKSKEISWDAVENWAEWSIN